MLLGMCLGIVVVADGVNDETRISNIIAVLGCIISVISTFMIGLIAMWQNQIYNKRQEQEKENRLKNIREIINSIMIENSFIIEEWDIKHGFIFDLCEKSYCKITFLRKLDVFSAINIDYGLFKVLNDYNNLINTLNFNISNYEKSVNKGVKKEITRFKYFIKQNVKEIQKLEKQIKEHDILQLENETIKKPRTNKN